MNHPKILLVEDEANFGAVLRDYLQMQDFDVKLCQDGEAGLEAFKERTYNLCILDVMMPKMDGFTLAKEIRTLNDQVPLIFLTARSMQEDVIKGFKLGGDDYITKPFDSEELLLRIQAILKRAEVNSEDPTQPTRDEFTFGQFHFNYRLNTIREGDERHKLSPKEADLLRLLLTYKDDLLPREIALRTLWGEDNYFNARSMDVFISKLRKRFKGAPTIRIENVHSKGFRLVEEAEEA